MRATLVVCRTHCSRERRDPPLAGADPLAQLARGRRAGGRRAVDHECCDGGEYQRSQYQGSGGARGVRACALHQAVADPPAGRASRAGSCSVAKSGVTVTRPWVPRPPRATSCTKPCTEGTARRSSTGSARPGPLLPPADRAARRPPAAALHGRPPTRQAPSARAARRRRAPDRPSRRLRRAMRC